jgi:hypothetical protein
MRFLVPLTTFAPLKHGAYALWEVGVQARVELCPGPWTCRKRRAGNLQTLPAIP